MLNRVAIRNLEKFYSDFPFRSDERWYDIVVVMHIASLLNITTAFNRLWLLYKIK